MLHRHSRAYRLTLLGVVVLVLGGGGYFAYTLYNRSAGTADLAKNAERAYESGKQALEAKELSKAQTALDEAATLTNKGLEALDEERKKAQNFDREKESDWANRRGKLLWLKAQILRDAAHNNAMIDGNPIPEMEDSATREMFRSITRIPAQSTRGEAIACLREAAGRLPRDLAVQQEALRLELLQVQSDWTNIEKASRNIITLDPDNVRANYYLARLEFEQPQEGTGKLADSRSRSRERVEAAREHLQNVKKAAYYPLWRILYLESEILKWLVKVAPAGAPETSKKEMERYKVLLFGDDKEKGALARAANKEGFTSLSKVDIEGIVNLHLAAVELGIDQARSSMAAESELFQALNALVDLAFELSASKDGKPFQGMLLEATMGAATKARRFLNVQNPPQWPPFRDKLEKLARQAADAHVSSPKGYSHFAQLLSVEAFLEGKQNKNALARKELEARALDWIKDGERLAEEAKEPASQRVELHGVALEILVGRNEKMELVAPHLEALRKVDSSRAKALLAANEATIFVRQGKLANAEKALNELTTNNNAADLRPRALILLANVLLSTQHPLEAVNALRDLEKSYSRIGDLSPVEQDYMREFLRDEREIAMLIAIAELETAVDKYDRYRKENPSRPIPDQFTMRTIKAHEDSAESAIKKLAVGLDPNRLARTAFVNYYLRLGDIEKALDAVESLKKDYSRSAEVLRLDVLMTMQPDRNKKDDDGARQQRQTRADGLIDAFITVNPTDDAAKRFKAEWLIRTDRSDKALMYLENPQNFPGGLDLIAKRMLAVLLFNDGRRDKGMQMLQQLPKDPAIEFLLIQATANPLIRQQLLEESTTKYENNGLFRVLEGEKLIAEEKYADAATCFWNALAFTRVTPAAQNGFLRSMFQLADRNPNKALELTDQFLLESPGDAVCYAMAAYALLKKDEIGRPGDSWDRNKTMWGALKAWEGPATKGGIDTTAKVLFRATYCALANRLDQAWDELEQAAANAKPPSEPILYRLVELAIDMGDDDKLAKAVNYLGLLTARRPNYVPLRLLEARLLNRMGAQQRAVAVLEGILKQQPKQLEVYPLLIRILNEHNQTKEAVLWTARWAQLDKENPVLILEQIRQELVAGRTETAGAQSTKFLIETEDALDKRLGQSTDLEFQKIKNERKRNVRAAANMMLAQTWVDGKHLEDADKFVADSLKADPKNLAARMYQAQIAIARKDWQKARQLYEGILPDHKDNWVVQANLGWLLAEHFNQPEEALKLIRSQMVGPFSHKPLDVMRLSPDFLDVAGQIFDRAGRKNKDVLDEMRTMFGDASRRYPSDPRIHLHLGEALAGLAEREQANNEYQNALRLAQSGKGPFSPDERQEFIQKVTQRMKGL